MAYLGSERAVIQLVMHDGTPSRWPALHESVSRFEAHSEGIQTLHAVQKGQCSSGAIIFKFVIMPAELYRAELRHVHWTTSDDPTKLDQAKSTWHKVKARLKSG